MTQNPTGPEEMGVQEEMDVQEEVEETCRLIRKETISPLTWFFPVSNACVSCVLFTGGHPEIMAAYCPRVLERLSDQIDLEEPEEGV